MSILRNAVKILPLTKTPSPVAILGSSQTRWVKRWVAPTLREFRRRDSILKRQLPATKEPQRRSDFAEWNYRAEIFAFGKRLQENFNLPLLQSAFTQRSYIQQEEQRQRELGIEGIDLELTANDHLAAQGTHLAEQYVDGFIKHSLPKLPAEGHQAFVRYLLSTHQLAHIATNLGMKEIIFASVYPPTAEDLSQSLLAVVGALAESSGVERAFLFVRDFICTELNQRDPLDMWQIEDPHRLLQQVCKERNLADPEPRLLGDCGKNTVLAAYYVGLYVDKRLLGKGFGEDIDTAIASASLDALQTLFGIKEHMRPFDFQLQVEPRSEKLSPN